MATQSIILPTYSVNEFDRGSATAAPSAPASFTATPADSSITLEWSSVSNILRYYIYYNTTGSPTTSDTRITISDPADVSYDHTGLTNGVTYYYKIAAIGSGGQSALSSQASATPDTFLNQNSVLFGGIDEYIDCGALHFAGTLSISLWYKFQDATKPIAITDKEVYNLPGFGIYITGATVEMDSGGGDYALGTALNDTNWHHMVFIWSGAVGTIYRDGVDITTDTSISSLNNGSSNFKIGKYAGLYSVGYMDEITTWDAALTSGNVTSLYNGGLPPDPRTLGISGLTHFWRMGEGATFPTIPDLVGSATGTMTNMESGDITTEVP